MKKRSTILAIIIVVILAVFWAVQGTHHSMNHVSYDAKTTGPDMAAKSFIEMMIPHHQEAVRTSLKVMQDPEIDNPDLRILAGRISDAQTFEIIQMMSWYEDWFGTEYDPSSNSTYMPMMADVENLTGEELEKAYMKGMIDHHKEAISMSEDLRDFIGAYDKKNTSSDGDLTITQSHPALEHLKIFTTQIIDAQSKEIKELSRLRSAK